MKGNFQREWVNACKDSLNTSCDFGYATDMIEMMLLGLVAHPFGRKIKYDGVTDCPEANSPLGNLSSALQILVDRPGRVF